MSLQETRRRYYLKNKEYLKIKNQIYYYYNQDFLKKQNLEYYYNNRNKTKTNTKNNIYLTEQAIIEFIDKPTTLYFS